MYHHVDTREVEKMENAEVRILRLESGMHFDILRQSEAGGTAN